MEVTYTSGQKLKISETSYSILPFSLMVFAQEGVISAIFSGFQHFFIYALHLGRKWSKASKIQRNAEQISAHIRKDRQNLTQVFTL